MIVRTGDSESLDVDTSSWNRRVFLYSLVTALFFVASSSGIVASQRHEDLAEPVTFASLLNEMVDRDVLPKKPIHSYRLGQASSYDRVPTSPSERWYANRDGSGFVRSEINHGRTERVLMDEKGPGAIVRFWSTYLTWEFNDGILRFYFDGADTPQIEGRLSQIIHGSHLVEGVLAQNTGEFLENNHVLSGRNLYLPLPYADCCKITYEGTDTPLYYAINFRRYADGTTVRTFSMEDLKQHASELASVQRELDRNIPAPEESELLSAQKKTIQPGQSSTASLHGTRAIRQIMVVIDAEDEMQALRSTVFEIKFDGEQTVWAPVGDFFGTGYVISPYESRYHTVTLDGRMLCRWVMPFQTSAEITIHNHGIQPITLKELAVHHTPWQWDDRSLYFYAAWRLYPQCLSARGRDTNYVTIRGQGKYIGDSLAIFKGVTGSEPQPWWGEGDEKIYIDGESFPSQFGTGTEDYYGYAWVGCKTFSQPFLSQPRAQANRGRGLTVNSRWRSLDAIPFNSSLKLDMEIWHWAKGVTVDYAPTTFWYGTLETKSAIDLQVDSGGIRPNDLAGVQRAVRSVDRIEAEGMAVESNCSGKSLVHTLPHEKRLSNRSYWLLRELQPLDKVTAQFRYPQKASGTLELALVRSPDSMVVDLFLNGKPLLTDIDLLGKGPSPVLHTVADVEFLKGVNHLVVEAKGTSSSNREANEVGIDYLRLLSD